jgi:hypothetical protein
VSNAYEKGASGTSAIKVEKSIGAKVEVGKVEAGMQVSSERTTVKDGYAVEHPETETNVTMGVGKAKAEGSTSGDIEVEATLGLIKVGVSVNPMAAIADKIVSVVGKFVQDTSKTVTNIASASNPEAN